jgi:glycosyltransferase involved in cell wall biosynthesis
MKVLLVHNYYRERGGEAIAYETERDALRAAGVTVVELTRDNRTLAREPLAKKLSLPLRTVWARDTQRALAELIAREHPDVAHFANTLPQISPAAYYTCQAAGVAVVQTLHNYRLACPAGTFLRQGRVCEECPEHGLQRAVRYACYRQSRAASAAVAGMLRVHRSLGTYRDAVDVYIAPTRFVRDKLIATARLPAHKVVVKPNFLAFDPGVAPARGDQVVFAGRLVDYKGIRTLMAAAALPGAPLSLRIIGDGPLQGEVQRRARGLGVQVLGALSREATVAEMRRARCLVLPSECYESAPTVILEAFACGVPVVASRLGAMADLVRHQQTGLLFTPGDARDLRDKLDAAAQHPEDMQRIGRAARAEFEARYSPARGTEGLLKVYAGVLARR